MSTTSLRKSLQKHYKTKLGYANWFYYEKKRYWTNADHLIRQKITREGHLLIARLFRKRLKLMGQMEALPESDETALLALSKKVTQNEFMLQDAWGYPRSEKAHRHWQLPHCRCPKLDNIDDYPLFQHYSVECVLHRHKLLQNLPQTSTQPVEGLPEITQLS